MAHTVYPATQHYFQFSLKQPICSFTSMSKWPQWAPLLFLLLQRHTPVPTPRCDIARSPSLHLYWTKTKTTKTMRCLRATDTRRDTGPWRCSSDGTHLIARRYLDRKIKFVIMSLIYRKSVHIEKKVAYAIR